MDAPRCDWCAAVFQVEIGKPSSPYIKLDNVESSEADCQDLLWPSEWTSVQWTEKKEKFKGLYCADGKIGCDICRKVSKLKTSQKIEISQEWATCEIGGGTNTNKKTRLTVLRNKLKKHFESNAHKSAVQILDNKDKNILSKLMDEKDYQINKATHSIFCIAYYIAKYNRPFDDHLKLVQLQELNGIKLGFTLHSRYSSTNILQYISKEMKHKIIKNIIDTNAKCSILIDESTTLSDLCSMVAYLKVSISNNEPLFIFLDLVELKNEIAKKYSFVGLLVVRAVNVVLKIFPALYKHLYTASNDSNRDSKTKNKYLGLLKKLASPEFVNDLAIMCDVLQELSNLSIELQSRTITLMQFEQSIKRCIRVIISFKTNNGDYMHQAVVAIKDMKFKNIDLTSNKKMISINKNQFLTSIENNLKSRLLDNDGENKIILKHILVLEKSTWPEDPDIRYGEDNIKYL
ncbi:Hypothetical protein CINCED_3A010564 [Cinara cedri]|uniref:DUF4371 domain-containing protein n=1 Tax=Cinara cedri TaxID=506608 RepID=A0A5E4MJT2_9HEMI|nr:Hypothetical protein CINCED_3A010564 [Cinara cedri]